MVDCSDAVDKGFDANDGGFADVFNSVDHLWEVDKENIVELCNPGYVMFLPLECTEVSFRLRGGVPIPVVV